MTLEKDYTNLNNVSLDKLYKLRDVAKDNVRSCFNDYEQANNRWLNIELEIDKRKLQESV